MEPRFDLPRFRQQFWELTRAQRVYRVSAHAGVAGPISFGRGWSPLAPCFHSFVI